MRRALAVVVLVLAFARGLSAQETGQGLSAADARYTLFEVDALRTETIDSQLQPGQPDVIEVRNRGDTRLRVTVMSAEFAPRVTVLQADAVRDPRSRLTDAYPDRIGLRTGFDPLELRTHGSFRIVVEAVRLGRGAGYRIRVEREPLAASLPSASSGDCDGNLIARVVRSHVSAVTACHTLALRRRSDLSGKITVHFVAPPVGVARDVAAAEDTVDDADMTRCVLAAFAALRFDGMCVDGSGQFSFPFIFTPQR